MKGATQLGEAIQGTSLVRRFEGQTEVAPLYRGQEPLLSQALDAAFEQAVALGYKSVYVRGRSYVLIGGEWYEWA